MFALLVIAFLIILPFAMAFGGNGVAIAAALIAGLFVYFAPTITAEQRGHMSSGAIFALNLFLGWTFLGWVAALVWSLTGDAESNRIVVVQTPRGTPVNLEDY